MLHFRCLSNVAAVGALISGLFGGPTAFALSFTHDLPATGIPSQTPPYPNVATITLTQVADGVEIVLDPNRKLIRRVENLISCRFRVGLRSLIDCHIEDARGDWHVECQVIIGGRLRQYRGRRGRRPSVGTQRG